LHFLIKANRKPAQLPGFVGDRVCGSGGLPDLDAERLVAFIGPTPRINQGAVEKAYAKSWETECIGLIFVISLPFNDYDST
jgi:hypothetical protein